MRDLCVAVMAFNRPKFLYVSLDSIFRNSSINDVGVNVYIDGGGTNLQDMLNTATSFPIDKVHVHSKNLMTLNSIMFALSDILYGGNYKKCFYLEDDHIIRSDTIKHCLEVETKEFFYCLGGKNGRGIDYRPKGNMIDADKFPILDEWIKDKKYIGMPRPGNSNQILQYGFSGHDAIFTAFMKTNSLFTEYAPEHYVATFGVFGIHSINGGGFGYLTDRFFAGDKNIWLDNVVKVLSEQPYGASPNLWPGERFKYQ